MICDTRWADGRSWRRSSTSRRQAEIAPQVFEHLLVLDRQLDAELDEVGTRDRDRLLLRLLGGTKLGSYGSDGSQRTPK